MILTLTMSPAVDMFAVTEQFFHDSKTRSQITRHLPGGGGINVARNLRRMGISTTAVFPAGGFHGELLSKLLEEDGQSCLRVSVTHETTQNIVLDEKTTGLALHLVFPGARLEKDEWLACQKCWSSVGPCLLLYLIHFLPSLLSNAMSATSGSCSTPQVIPCAWLSPKESIW